MRCYEIGFAKELIVLRTDLSNCFHNPSVINPVHLNATLNERPTEWTYHPLINMSMIIDNALNSCDAPAYNTISSFHPGDKMADNALVELLRTDGSSGFAHWRESHKDATANLVNADLTGLDLRKIDLYGANLERANLTDADIRGASFAFTNLTCARLNNVVGDAADFSFARLTKADCRSASFTECTFECATAEGVILDDATLTSSSFSGTILRYATLRRARLREANLTQTDLRYATITDVDLAGAVLIDTDLACAKWDGRDPDDLWHTLARAKIRSHVVTTRSALEAKSGMFFVQSPGRIETKSSAPRTLFGRRIHHL